MDDLKDAIQRAIPASCRDHLGRLWLQARECHAARDFPQAVFAGVTLIEESGKLVLFVQRVISTSVGQSCDTAKFEKAFYSHSSKYGIAEAHSLLINSRFDRVYAPYAAKIKAWFSNRALFELRNSALYLEILGDGLQAPSERIDESTSTLLVSVAGEIYAELQGSYLGAHPADWRRIIEDVDEFLRRSQRGQG